MFILYSFLLSVGFILLLPIFLLKREKYASGFWQRMGYLPDFKQDGRSVLWLHCVSVGEANAARPLVSAIKKQFPNYRLVVSTTTKTGQELAQNIFRDAAEAVFYFPFDWRFTVRRALGRFQPNVVLLFETELWFNFIREANMGGAFVAVVNGRLSEKSFKRYSKIQKFMRRVLRRVDLALMQSSADAKRLLELGIRPSKVKTTGNIKFDQKSETYLLTETFRQRFGFSESQPLIVASSTHAPEERWILQAFKEVYKNAGGNLPRLLIAPRHPQRFDEVFEIIKETGFSAVKRSAEPSPDDELADVVLLDSIGELRAVYPLAEIVFVGGSLIAHGGQSILEPAVAGKPIVTGFYTTNFTAAVKEFLNSEALIQLPKTDDQAVVIILSQTFSELLQNPSKKAQMAQNALAVMQKNRGATKKTIEALRPFLQVHEKK